jgi:putative ABC transport system substrate-binding protein
MRRRNFIASLASITVARPIAARAQLADKRRHISVLMGLPQGDPEGEKWKKALFEGLTQFGWKPDSNLTVDLRWVSTNLAGLQDLANELVELKPDVIQVSSTPATAAILRTTHTIPVVFSNVSDPVGSGFVKNLSHPGGNATGFINIEASVASKWLELLKEVAPDTSRFLVIFNPKTAPQSYYYLRQLEAAAPSFSLTPIVVNVSTPDEIESAINSLAKTVGAGLVITPDLFTAAQPQRDQIISLAARNRIPAIYSSTLYVKAGGLLSYGTDYADLQRRAAGYVDQILKGAKPDELPVQLPTKFELGVNTKTAKALGLKIPASLLATSDEVIE